MSEKLKTNGKLKPGSHNRPPNIGRSVRKCLLCSKRVSGPGRQYCKDHAHGTIDGTRIPNYTLCAATVGMLKSQMFKKHEQTYFFQMATIYKLADQPVTIQILLVSLFIINVQIQRETRRLYDDNLTDRSQLLKLMATQIKLIEKTGISTETATGLITGNNEVDDYFEN